MFSSSTKGHYQQYLSERWAVDTWTWRLRRGKASVAPLLFQRTGGTASYWLLKAGGWVYDQKGRATFCPVNETNEMTIWAWAVLDRCYKKQANNGLGPFSVKVSCRPQTCSSQVLLKKKKSNVTYKWALNRQAIFKFLHCAPLGQFVQRMCLRPKRSTESRRAGHSLWALK